VRQTHNHSENHQHSRCPFIVKQRRSYKCSKVDMSVWVTKVWPPIKANGDTNPPDLTPLQIWGVRRGVAD
jgi:hypothetical protein